jgi:hypothetical protein
MKEIQGTSQSTLHTTRYSNTSLVLLLAHVTIFLPSIPKKPSMITLSSFTMVTSPPLMHLPNFEPDKQTMHQKQLTDSSTSETHLRYCMYVQSPLFLIQDVRPVMETLSLSLAFDNINSTGSKTHSKPTSRETAHQTNLCLRPVPSEANLFLPPFQSSTTNFINGTAYMYIITSFP